MPNTDIQYASQAPALPESQPLRQTPGIMPGNNKIPAQNTEGQGPPAEEFPTPADSSRLNNYDYYNRLLLGEHFEAFRIKIDNTIYGNNYGKLRYISVNFAGLLSKVVADMLFSEPLKVDMGEDGDQDFVDALVYENDLNTQWYESALDNSARGDAVFKLRVDKRYPQDKNATVIIEEINPSLYFPKINPFNVKAAPEEIVLAWTFMIGKKKYLRKEVHKIGTIEDHIYEMEGNKVGAEVDLAILGIDGLKGVGFTTETKIERMMVIHIPNWKTGEKHFGFSDYYDLDKLFYAINNRITKIDNILDRHADPILMVPQGIINDDGTVKKQNLQIIEMPEGATDKEKPEYIVWDANMEAGFNEIDRLIDAFMMTGEITKDVLGMGEGLNDSGRALKFKLMRTIAKVARKKLYFDNALKEMIYVAQLLAKAHGVGVGPDNIKLLKDPELPNLVWQDGLPIDDYEDAQLEIEKIDAGIQSKKDAIMNLDGVDEETAQEKLDDIKDENPVMLPGATTAGDINDDGSVKKPAGTSQTAQPPRPKQPPVKK